MYLVGIAWMYVAVMMAVAEATSSQGSVSGAIFTLLLYGVLPLSILLYIMGTGRRRKAARQREAHAQGSAQADGSHHAPAETGAPVGKEP
jgi:mannose/fructose/N-acetylgalactosamine-specific phosphotransferase system component IID